MSEHKKRIRHVIYFILFGLAFALLAIYYEYPLIFKLNTAVQSLIYNYSDGAYFSFFDRMTNLGSASLYIILCIILCLSFLIMKHYLGLIFVPVNLIGSALFNTLLKQIFLKPRPEVHHLVQAQSYSFPSGHAMNALVFYGLLAFLFSEFFEKRWARQLTWFLSAALILFIGMSRVYLGVHYPIDIIGGYLAGLAWLAIILFVYSLLKERTHWRLKE